MMGNLSILQSQKTYIADQPIMNELSTLCIRMPKVKISCLEKNTFLYEINVQSRWARWHLQKKFIDFERLHEELSQVFDNLSEFPNPLLGFLIADSEDDAEEKRELLEIYLQKLSLRRQVISETVFAQFLQIGQYSPQLLVSRPKLIEEFQMEERINDEGKTILDLYYDQKFIVYATGNDSPLEKFNSIVANTQLPWESQDEKEYILPLGSVQCWLKKPQGGYRRGWARNYPTQTRKVIFDVRSMLMIVGLADGNLQFFKLIQKTRFIHYKVIKLLSVHEQEVCGLHLDPASNNAFSVSVDGVVITSDASKGFSFQRLELQADAVSMCADSSTCRLFVGLSEGAVAVLGYDAKGFLSYIHTIRLPGDSSVKAMTFEPIKNYLFTGCPESGRIFIFDVYKPGSEKLTQLIGTLEGRKGVVDLIWQNSKTQLISTIESGQVIFWDTRKGQAIYTLKSFQKEKQSFSKLISQHNLLITASRSRKVKFWELPRQWRDPTHEAEQERELEIRRKVLNLHNIREAQKRREIDSDDDDLVGWHWEDQQNESD